MYKKPTEISPIWKKQSGSGDSNHRIKFSPNGKYILISGTADNTIRLFFAESGVPLKHFTCREHSGECTVSADFSHAGEKIISSCLPYGHASIWNVATGTRELHRKPPFTDMYEFMVVQPIFCSPDGKYVIGAGSGVGQDGYIYDSMTLRAQKTIHGIAAHHHVAFSPDGQFIATGELRIYHISSLPAYPTGSSSFINPSMYFHPSVNRYCSYSRDGNFLVAGGQDTKVTVWNIHTGQREKVLIVERVPVIFCSFVLGDNYVVAVCQTGETHVLEIKTEKVGRLLTQLPHVPSNPNAFPQLNCSAHTSPCGRYLIIITTKGEVSLWNIQELIDNCPEFNIPSLSSDATQVPSTIPAQAQAHEARCATPPVQQFPIPNVQRNSPPAFLIALEDDDVPAATSASTSTMTQQLSGLGNPYYERANKTYTEAKVAIIMKKWQEALTLLLQARTYLKDARAQVQISPSSFTAREREKIERRLLKIKERLMPQIEAGMRS